MKQIIINWFVKQIIKYNEKVGAMVFFLGVVERQTGMEFIENTLPFWLWVFFPICYIDEWEGAAGLAQQGYLYYRLFPVGWLKFKYEI